MPDAPLQPLSSTLGDDPDMVELIMFFLDNLEAHVEALRGAWTERDLETIRTTSHQLRGAGAGYGYPEITDVAGDLESALSEEMALSDLGERVEALIRTCRRAGLGRPGNAES